MYIVVGLSKFVGAITISPNSKSSNYYKFWSSKKSGATSASPDFTSSSTSISSTSLSRVVTTRWSTALDVFYVKWLAFWKSYADSTILSPQANSISYGLWGCSTKSFRIAKRFAMTLQSCAKSEGGSRIRFVSLLKVTFSQRDFSYRRTECCCRQISSSDDYASISLIINISLSST